MSQIFREGVGLLAYVDFVYTASNMDVYLTCDLKGVKVSQMIDLCQQLN